MATAVAAAQSAGSRLREAMTPDEFRAAGLDKLDAAELAALEAWLRRRGALADEPAPGGVRFARPY
ncbi:hypothetical protein CR938_07410, partial [Pseudoxanthomonas taiwanensis]